MDGSDQLLFHVEKGGDGNGKNSVVLGALNLISEGHSRSYHPLVVVKGYGKGLFVVEYFVAVPTHNVLQEETISIE